jgi:hypothetical protein
VNPDIKLNEKYALNALPFNVDQTIIRNRKKVYKK